MLLAGVMHYTNQNGVRKITTFLQVLFLSIAIANVVNVSNSMENKQGLSSVNQTIAWIISGNILFYYNLIFLKISLHNIKKCCFIFSFINVFNKKNFKSLIEQNNCSFIN